MMPINKEECMSNSICHCGAESITEEIMAVYSAVRGLKDNEIYQDTSNRLRTVFQRLDSLIARDIGDKRAEEILYNSRFNSTFDTIGRFRSMYTAKLEIDHAKSILKSRDPWEALRNFAYFANYLQLARTEYEGSRLKPGDCVLFLGSGPLPLSLIVLCHQYGLRGIGIEQEPERAELSRRVLEKLGLSDQIKIITGNHFTLPLKEKIELVMVAAQAEPKKAIFDHLAKVLPEGTKISYRIYEKGLRKLLDTFSRYDLPERLEEYLRVRPKPPANNTVVFLIANGMGYNSTTDGLLRVECPTRNTEEMQDITQPLV
jgi:hypothetical protein